MRNSIVGKIKSLSPFVIIVIIALFITYHADKRWSAWILRDKLLPGKTSIEWIGVEIAEVNEPCEPDHQSPPAPEHRIIEPKT